MLFLAGGLDRLRGLLGGGVVAIVGSAKASDYGMEMAMSLGRGLSASGVTVTAGVTDGIARAALTGAIEAGGRTVIVVGGGLEASPPRARALLARLAESGCAVSELPRRCPGRRWAVPAGQRTIAALAGLTIVVEAEESPRALAPARMASALGRGVAALPGRVTSPLSRGPHALLAEGASLVRGASDALELLYSLGAPPFSCEKAPASFAKLEPRLQRTLDRVASGDDTPDKLADGEANPEALLLALTELELLGLLARGDGGRYLPRAR
jgi:DNA processing protein